MYNKNGKNIYCGFPTNFLEKTVGLMFRVQLLFKLWALRQFKRDWYKKAEEYPAAFIIRYCGRSEAKNQNVIRSINIL